MNICRMKANHLTTPVGCALPDLSLSWVAESETAVRQKTARVEIARDPAFTGILFDSGPRADVDSLGFQPGIPLPPRTRLHWRVTVVADNGETASGTAWFETGKMNEPWGGAWITAPFGNGQDACLLRKTFTVDKPGETRVYCAGLGIYELAVNGRPATDEVLLPGYHSYTLHVHAQTFDITPLLQAGANTLAFHVGPGWYNSSLGWNQAAPYGSTIGIRCEVRGACDGTDTLIAVSDETWTCAPSPVTKSGIYYGEDYDARREIDDWSSPACATGDWRPARCFTPAEGEAGPITDRLSPPIRIQQTLTPDVITTPAGETVLDFKQELTGWVEIINRAPVGATWRFEVGEILQKGNFYRDNLRVAEAQYTYTSNGRMGPVRPHFTFYGFRYVKLHGFPATVDPADFKAHVIHSDLDQTGTITTSDAKINQLFENARWGQKGNFLDVPTDCPQRDERLGWTGDAQVFAGTACFNMDCAAFYAKYMKDLMLEQAVYEGGVPHTVPALAEWLRTRSSHSSCAWGDVATVLPWTVFTYTGDVAQLRREYPAMRAWTDHLQRMDDANGGRRLWQTGSHFADWLALDNYKDPTSCVGATDPHFIASAYYARSAELTAKAAQALGNASDAKRYRALCEAVKTAIQQEYFTPSGRCAVDTQTAHALALHFNLVPDAFRPRLIETLAGKIEANDHALATGFVGTPILCRVLSDNGRSDLAHALLLREKFPGWLYAVNLGATTIWERWNSLLEDGTCSGTGMNSMNHYAYGSIVEWMYRNLCGLRPREDAPGFRDVIIRPDRPRHFESANLSFASPAGTYAVAWTHKDGVFTLTCRIPFNARATLILPDAPEHITLNGESVPSRDRVLDAGTHTLTYPL